MLVSTIFQQYSDYWTLYHKITVDYLNKIIYVNEEVTEFDIKIDLYSDLKEVWALDSLAYSYNRFRPPIRSIGGDPTGPNTYAGDIYFMRGGWRVAYDPTQTSVTGILFSDDYDTPWVYLKDLSKSIYPAKVSSLVNTVAIGGGGSSYPTAEEIATAVADEFADTTMTPETIATEVWSTPMTTASATSGSIGEYIKKKLLTVAKFLALK